MLQVIEGKKVYVVDFDTMPELPITGYIPEELAYENFVKGVVGWNLNGLLGSIGSGFRPMLSYAQALTDAIEKGTITEPGKYGIHVIPGSLNYEVFTIVE